MEELIKQAFLHIDVIGPHVAEGHYDLIGPNGDIILPQVWETTVEPDWAITMKMWPLPEPPPPPPAPPPDKPAEAAAPGSEAAAAAKPAEAPDHVVLVEPGKSPKEIKSSDAKPPPPPPPPVPAANGKGPGAPEGVIVVGSAAVTKKAQPAKLPPLLAWTAGTRVRQSKKAEKKPEESVSHVQPPPPPPPPPQQQQQHDDVCRLM